MFDPVTVAVGGGYLRGGPGAQWMEVWEVRWYAIQLLIQGIVAFQLYDTDGDGYISNGELFDMMKLISEDQLTDVQIQQVRAFSLMSLAASPPFPVVYTLLCEWLTCLGFVLFW